MKSLTTKQRVFVLSYCMHRNTARAAREAFGSVPGDDRRIGFNTLRLMHVREAVTKIMQKRAEQFKIDADWVLKKLLTIAELSAQDFTEIDDFGRHSHDLSDLTPEQWAAIASVKYKPDGSIEIKTYDKLKALEAIGKHISVNAFRDRVGVSAPDGGALKVANQFVFVPVDSSYAPDTN